MFSIEIKIIAQIVIIIIVLHKTLYQTFLCILNLFHHIYYQQKCKIHEKLYESTMQIILKLFYQVYYHKYLCIFKNAQSIKTFMNLQCKNVNLLYRRSGVQIPLFQVLHIHYHQHTSSMLKCHHTVLYRIGHFRDIVV